MTEEDLQKVILDIMYEGPERSCSIRTKSGYFVNTQIKDLTGHIQYVGQKKHFVFPLKVHTKEGQTVFVTADSIDVVLLYNDKCQAKGTRIQSRG